MGKNFFKELGKQAKAPGKWVKGAAEDSFKWTTKTAGNVGNRVLDFAEAQTSKITDIFTNPTFLLVAGGVVLLVILMKT